jgi:hypothetical protein
MQVDHPCPDGSVITVRVHDTPQGRRIEFRRGSITVGIFDPATERVYVAALRRVYPLSDDVVPASPCELPLPGVRT